MGKAMGAADYVFSNAVTSQCAADNKVRLLGPATLCPVSLMAECVPGQVETTNPYIIDFSEENLSDMSNSLFQDNNFATDTFYNSETIQSIADAKGILSAFNANGVLIRAAFRQRVCTPCAATTYSNYTIPVTAGGNTYDQVVSDDGTGTEKWLLNYYAKDGTKNVLRPSSCETCDPGSVTNTLTSTGATTCTACDAGDYSANSTTACATCVHGSVTDTLTDVGAKSCTACDPGTYTSGPTDTCTACAAGEFSTTPTTPCATCDAGSVTDTLTDTGAKSCTACAAGDYSANSQTACAPCVIGTYSASPAAEQCAPLAEVVGGTYVTNIDQAYKAGAAVDYVFNNLDVCDSGEYATNEISRFASKLNASSSEILIPATQRTCADCFVSLKQQKGTDNVWDKIQHESGLQLPQRVLCEDDTTGRNICGAEHAPLICKSTSTDATNEDTIDSSDIQMCAPGWYLNIVADGIDTCESCVKSYNAYGWDERFPLICVNGSAVDPIQGYCQLDDAESRGLIVDFTFENQAAQELKCSAWNKCNAVDEAEDVQPDVGGLWDRTCRCKTENIVGALESACKSDADGHMTEALHPTSCKDGFRLREAADPTKNKCVFDFTHQHSSAAAGVCHFSKISDLFEYRYVLSDGNETLATAGENSNPITYNAVSEQQVFPKFRGEEKRLLELELTLHLEFLKDDNDQMKSDSGYTFFEYKFGQNSNQPFTSSSGTWVQITAPTLVSHKTCFTKPAYQLTHADAVTPAMGSEGPWTVKSLEVDPNCDTQTSVPLLEDLDQQYSTIAQWKDRQSANFFNDVAYTSSVDYLPIVHKLIGVASNCKNGNPTPADIFAWADLWGTAEDDIEITASISIGNVDAEPGAGFGGDLNVTTNVFQAPGATSSSLAKDLLFVSGAYDSGAISRATGTSSTQKSVSFSMAGSGSGIQRHGDLALTGKMDVSCTATMTVSGDEENFRCYENTASDVQAETGGTDTNNAIPAIGQHATCQVKLDSKCDFKVVEDMTVVDNRVCYNVQTKTECDTEFASTSESVTDFGYTVEQNCVIVEAVRLHSSRKYPKQGSDAVLPIASDFNDVEEQGSLSLSETYFNCDDENCVKDPYLVIKRKDTISTISGGWAGAGMTFVDGANNELGTYTPTTGCADPFESMRTTRDCVSPTTHTGVIKIDDEAIASTDVLKTISNDIANNPIILPGADYPNIYVFSLCTFTKEETSNTDYDENTTYSSGPTRRLGAPAHSYSAHGESYTILVPSVTDASH